MSTGERVRVATPGDIPAITETISLAFHDDPTWSWAFPDDGRRQEQYAIWWRFLIEAAMRFEHPAVFVTEGIEAAAIWLPPGEAELSAEDEARVPEIVRGLVGDRAGDFMELLEGFETVQPADPPHYYLSLLGVHDDHRGKGIGMACSRRTSRGSTARACPPIWSRATRSTTRGTRAAATEESGRSTPRTIRRRSPPTGGTRASPCSRSPSRSHRRPCR
jgi:GNAT superfamily N-acetyltransferase